MQQKRAGRRSAWAARISWLVPVLSLLCLVAAVPSGSGEMALHSRTDTTTITIQTYSDALTFEPDLVRVKARSVVRIRYINSSLLSHNLVVLKSEDDIDAIGAASHDARDTGFVPMQYKSKMIAFSALAAPGKTVEVIFAVPPVGEYPFVCFVDGHFNMMIGKLRVIP